MSQTRSKRLKRKSDQFYDEEKGKKSRKLDKLSTSNGFDVTCGLEDNLKNKPHPMRCTRAFYTRPCVDLAKALLGCVLVRCSEEKVLKGTIVETEAYLGGEDKAAHSYGGRVTERNAAMFMEPGTAYVYSVYGMHHCFNISSEGDGAAVLVRALEPLEGIEEMAAHRKNGKSKKAKDLCNGPAKLCEAFRIDRSCDKLDLVTSCTLWVEEGGLEKQCINITEVKRIGVDYAEEWADKPLRFYIGGNSCVSKK